jgi:archaemetzincin
VRSRPVRATPECGTLAFLPVGEFRDVEKRVAQATYRFAGLWFDLPVEVLGTAGLPREGFQRVREFPWYPEPVKQYRTDWFLNRLLPPRLPEKAVMLAGVTAADLYPSDDWNYVFGIASLRRRVGVYSIRRYFPEFWGEPETAESYRVALRRAIKLVTHELGHCFGLLHCIEYECNLNGSNSLSESDGRPLFLCPVCLKKLTWNLRFDVLDRYESLLAFYEAEGLSAEARWTRDRIARIAAIR